MNRLLFAATIVALGALAACNDPEPEPQETLEPSIEAPVAPPIEEAPAVTQAPAPVQPTDNSALPPESRTSEETVKPESDTLFY